ncbi:hypothetical protein [Halomonas kalidii]|uniref:Lipoprotein n=1 Tax=Halomonas kalidii TaxID=3043293 RepID=A0ABT6VI08_9GAMM|nr:hypothetical protein [Halomonas kalidii]MDI5933613.1 hypothetical protein [Halomonas kalidii]
MTHDKQTRIPGTGRRLAAAASIVALSLGSLALAGCDNDDDMPPLEQDAPMEEPAQDPGMQDGAGENEEPMGSQEPMEEEPMDSDEPVEEEPMGSDAPVEEDEPVEEEAPMSSDEPTLGDEEEQEQEDS